MKKIIYFSIGIIVLVIVIIILVLSSGGKKISGLPKESGQVFSQELKSENIDSDSILVESDTIKVSYNQATDFEIDDIFATWAYIMVSAAKNAPESVSKVAVQCNFEDGNKILITASVSDILSFSNEEITIGDFFSKVEVEPLTEGPEISAK